MACSGSRAASTPPSAARSGGVGSPMARDVTEQVGQLEAGETEVGEQVEFGPEVGAELVDERRGLGRFDVLAEEDAVAERPRPVVDLLDLEALDDHLLELGGRR